MSENGESPISDLEREFIDEQKGEGALSLNISDGSEKSYLGYDLNLEDVEALYFDGIGVPRWESLEGTTVEQKTALYWERFNDRMDKYPLIGRTRDTDEKVEYTSDEMPSLSLECEQVSSGTSNAKALRAAQKISLAAERAASKQAGLVLTPTQSLDPWRA
ncbi:MAG: hypothetical protein HOP17_17500 [Acidobacteria bacterium]|nr:hypothetical protein [Acidobacteriota bacterium]